MAGKEGFASVRSGIGHTRNISGPRMSLGGKDATAGLGSSLRNRVSAGVGTTRGADIFANSFLDRTGGHPRMSTFSPPVCLPTPDLALSPHSFPRNTNMQDVYLRLAQDTELHKLLADEKMRSEQHRINYQSLKTEHTRVQHELQLLQSELKRVQKDKEEGEETSHQALLQAKRDVEQAKVEVEKLKQQFPSQNLIEARELQLREEIESAFRRQLTQVEEELDEIRTSFNQLRYQHAFLKSEYEHAQLEHGRQIEEIKLKYETQLSQVQKEKAELLSNQGSSDLNSDERLCTLQHENATLHLKVKNLLIELQEAQARKESLGLQSDNIHQLQAKQIEEYSTSFKALEAEKSSLRMQIENLQKQLQSTVQTQIDLEAQVHKAKEKNDSQKAELDNLKHRHMLEQTELQLKMTHRKGELEREKDVLKKTVEDLQNQVEMKNEVVQHLEARLVEKEREMSRRTQSIREAEWEKVHSLQAEKMDLEVQVQKLERRQLDLENQEDKHMEELQNKVKKLQEEKNSQETELLHLQTKIQNQNSLLQELEVEKSAASSLRQEMNKLTAEFKVVMEGRKQMQVDYERMKQRLREREKEVEESEKVYTNMKQEKEKMLVQQQVNFEEVRHQLKDRITCLETEIKDLHTEKNITTDALKEKCKKYSRLIQKLRDRLETCETKLDKVEVERDSLKDRIPQDTHNQLRKQLQDLQRKHGEFSHILSSLSITDPNRQKQMSPLKEMNLLKDRLSSLDLGQKSPLVEAEPTTIFRYGDDEKIDSAKD